MENIKHINIRRKVKATRMVASFVSHCSVQHYGEKPIHTLCLVFVVVERGWCKNCVLASRYSTNV